VKEDAGATVEEGGDLKVKTRGSCRVGDESMKASLFPVDCKGRRRRRRNRRRRRERRRQKGGERGVFEANVDIHTLSDRWWMVRRSVFRGSCKVHESEPIAR